MADQEGSQEITSKMENPSDSASASPDAPQTSENPSSPTTSPDTPKTSENPPSPHSNSSGKQPITGTPKERLKKARSSSQSFCSVVKRIKVENEENDQTLSEPGESSKEENCSKAQESLKNKDNEPEKESSENKNTCDSKSPDTGSSSAPEKDSVTKTTKQSLKEEKAKLTRQVQEKEDLLRRLKLVKMYRIKNDVTELEDLIKKWRKCGQRLLRELQSIMSEDEDEKLTLTELIDYYGIDDKLLHYNRHEEEFTGV
ncbi:swi5-dependent recombination DNA repair protein 1 homolog [Arvicanthis niloticus]|uniref:swi5-dependent recombination DNA repair protein 1 homolog n=1 Tax=Arvicanthis niloticus TaxID=61156 RepID=UPI0014860A0C|nr:swi5-dependent recombination DNA repair protein 1 homolog [Arvicanthis niloticus]